MASISFDGQSFILDGRRLWVVAGTCDYAAVPADRWDAVLQAVRLAGFNTIVCSAPWCWHEPQPGCFRFDGQADLHRFLERAGRHGLHAVLRAGPYVGPPWDFGGLPAWLLDTPGIRTRQSHPVFLQAVARYFDALVGQFNDLQATKSGPLLAVQVEHQWCAGHDEQAEQYLGQLVRFLREAGCRLPLLNTNNLWQPVDGTIDAWSGHHDPLALGRQLHRVRPDQPRLLTDLPTGPPACWGRPYPPPRSPGHLLADLARATAAGCQVHLHPLVGPALPGFLPGRLDEQQYLLNRPYPHAPIGPDGRTTRTGRALKTLTVFLDRHADLLAHMAPDQHHTAAATGLTVVQQNSSPARLVLAIRDQSGGPDKADLLLPDGRRLTIHFGQHPAAWLLLDYPLNARAHLDLTNLRPWALLDGRLLVLFGPARSPAQVSINDALFSATVPQGPKPLLAEHQGILLCLCNTQQIESALIRDEQLYLGTAGFDDQGRPLRLSNTAPVRIVRPDGSTELVRTPRPRPPRLSPPPLRHWQRADCRALADGSASLYAAIDGPRSLEQCGADFGYGWYRLQLNLHSARQVRLMAPGAADRLHLYLNGRLKAVLGFGPGARSLNQPLPLHLPAGRLSLVFLADNLGRLTWHDGLSPRRGLYDHLYHVRPRTLPRPIVHHPGPFDPFQLDGFLPGLRFGDTSAYPRFTWTIDHRKTCPFILVLDGPRPPLAIYLNDQPLAVDGSDRLSRRLLLSPDHLRRGRNHLTLICLQEPPARFNPNRIARLYEATENLSSRAHWAFARWTMPDDNALAEPPARTPAGPAWFACTFDWPHPHMPLALELNGLSKGQVYLNDHHLGRYFQATASGARVGPLRRLGLPAGLLQADKPNRLVLFDEHGRSPSACKLVLDDPARPPHRGERP